MKIVIVGPGAIGCLFGAFFLKAGEEVCFLDKDKKRTAVFAKKGIRVEGLSNFRINKIKVTHIPKIVKEADLVLIATKAYATEFAIRNIYYFLSPQTFVLTLQNGLGNVETISQYVPCPQILAGVTAQGATFMDIGHIRHAGKGETIIGPIVKSKYQKVKLEQIVDAFHKAGFKTKLTTNVESLLWSKLIINSAINPLTAITKLPNGRLLDFPFTRQIMQEVVGEAYRIVKKKKIRLFYSQPFKEVEEVCKKTYSNISSMLQDVLHQRRTEIDFINGVLVREGRRLNIPTPVNSVLFALIKTLESSYNLKVN
ncbi:MAG: 2-dehydropantoate 2-reductase [Candidatus Omnitrophica bacterium]|nr:2-dehydropantoate 2-reductase [Candidatus Omnitrophota bacterium]